MVNSSFVVHSHTLYIFFTLVLRGHRFTRGRGILLDVFDMSVLCSLSPSGRSARRSATRRSGVLQSERALAKQADATGGRTDGRTRAARLNQGACELYTYANARCMYIALRPSVGEREMRAREAGCLVDCCVLWRSSKPGGVRLPRSTSWKNSLDRASFVFIEATTTTCSECVGRSIDRRTYNFFQATYPPTCAGGT